MPSSRTVIGFGSNYFHALGGTEPAGLSVGSSNEQQQQCAESSHEHVDAHCLDDPPWRKKKDRVIQVVCSATSTVFVTQQGRVYQTGTLHGTVWTSPTRIEIVFPRKCVQVAAGRHFCIGMLERGVGVVSWGAGHFGQLGLGPHVSGVEQPQLIPHLLPQALGTTRVQQVAAGAWHALALLDSGKVMAWGSNRKCQCGVKPSTTNKSPPTLVVPHPMEFYGKFCKVACGRLHSVGLEEGTGRVYTWGASHFGQCGQYSRKGCIVPPRLVEALQRVAVVDVAAGDSHSLALTGGGRVFGWGSGMDGQLGLGAVVPISRPKLVADLDFVAIEAGREWKQQQQQQAQQDMPSSRSASECSAGRVFPASPARPNCRPDSPTSLADSSFASSGRAYDLSNVPKIVAIDASGSYSVAISSSGHVYTWGYNDVGQLGLPQAQNLPYVEVTSPTMKPTSSGRLLEIRSFDSRCNVLLPRRVDALSDTFISSVAAGPCHLWCIGKPRDAADKDMVGRTLYEVQEERRRKGLVRLREELSSLAVSTSSPVPERDTLKESPVKELMIPEIVTTPAASAAADGSVTTLETQPSVAQSQPSVGPPPSTPSEFSAAISYSPIKREKPTAHGPQTPTSQGSQAQTTPTSQGSQAHAEHDVHMPLPELNDSAKQPPSTSNKPSPSRGLGRSLSLTKLINKKREKAKARARTKSYKELSDSPSNEEPPSPTAFASSNSSPDECHSASIPKSQSEADVEPLEEMNREAPSTEASPLRRGRSMSKLIQRARKTRQRK